MGIDADVLWNHWHSLGVIVHDDHFAVSLDHKPPFTAFDRTRMKDGGVGLRTQEGYPFSDRNSRPSTEGGALVQS